MMKWRWPWPGTGDIPTMLGEILKCPRRTRTVNFEPTCTPSRGVTTATVGRGPFDGAAGLVICMFICADMPPSLAWGADDDPHPTSATAARAAPVAITDLDILVWLLGGRGDGIRRSGRVR